MREALTKKVAKENGIKCSPEQAVVTNGSQEALMLAAASTLDATEQVIIPSPAFLGYTPMFELLDIFPVFSKLDEEFLPDIDDMRKKITKKTKSILICTPSNPTGAVYPRKTLDNLRRKAHLHSIVERHGRTRRYISELLEKLRDVRLPPWIRHRTAKARRGNAQNPRLFYNFCADNIANGGRESADAERLHEKNGERV